METKHQILIADDHHINREFLKILCQSKGFEVIEARNGREAVELASLKKPSLILMDVMMPELNGFQATEKLKQQEQTKHIPIIIVTSLDNREERLNAIEKGANDFLTKPVDFKELELRIRNNLQVKQYQELLEKYNSSLEQQVEHKTIQLRQAFKNVDLAYQDAINRLSLAAEFRDPETGAHIQRVSYYVKIIAQKLGMDQLFLENIFHAAPMHDIGKVGIPDNVLLKKGALTEEEWQTMKSHTLIGEKILRGSESEILRLAAEIALTHHERWDGSGYPNGIKGDDIPIAGRIMAIADVYDALRSKRPYKPAIDHNTAFEIITVGDRRTHPNHFAPDVLQVFKEQSHLLNEIYESYQD